MPIKKIREHWRRFGSDSKTDKLLMASFVLSLLIVSILQMSAKGREDVPVDTDLPVDTYIPDGQVLVPIEVANAAALEGVLDSFGIVDLYPVQESGRPQSVPFARGIKILRAPLDRSQFGVLVPEDQSPRIASHNGGFVVVIRNRKNPGPIFEKVKAKGARHAQIEYEEPAQ